MQPMADYASGQSPFPVPLGSALPTPLNPLDRNRLHRLSGPLLEVVRALGHAGGASRTDAHPVADPVIPPGARFPEAIHQTPAGSRHYRSYLPASLAKGAPRGLILMLHGCGQTPDDFAVGTRMNAHAEAHRLILVYPAQGRIDNPRGCWNWFRPAHQGRGTGEPEILADLARTVAAGHGVPPGRVFVAGLSAGGTMAAVLGASYPELFAGVGVHSGTPQGSANDALSALAVMRGEAGPGQQVPGLEVPLIVFHGDADTVVHPANGVRLATAGREADARHARRGCTGGRRFSRWVERGDGSRPPLEYWSIEGAGHAWSGGDAAGSFADAEGPDASAEMVRFFLGLRRPTFRLCRPAQAAEPAVTGRKAG
jgi:poly(hydroxyalkanoate) depolymerase family esterase